MYKLAQTTYCDNDADDVHIVKFLIEIQKFAFSTQNFKLPVNASPHILFICIIKRLYF